MSELTAEFAALAVELLTEEGTQVVLTRRTPTAMTASGDRTQAVPPSTTLGLIFPFKGGGFEDERAKPSEMMMVLPTTPDPEPGDIVTINGKTRVIDRAFNYAPDGLPIVSQLFVTL